MFSNIVHSQNQWLAAAKQPKKNIHNYIHVSELIVPGVVVPRAFGSFVVSLTWLVTPKLNEMLAVK